MAKGRGLVAQALVSRRGQPLDLKGEEGEEEETALKLMLQSNSGWSLNFTFLGEYCKEIPRYDKKKGEGMAKPGVNRMAAVKQVLFPPADLCTKVDHVINSCWQQLHFSSPGLQAPVHEWFQGCRN